MARRIIEVIPKREFRCFVDGTFGGGSVLLNLEPFEREVVYDLDRSLIDFWINLQSPVYFPDFLELFGPTEYAEATFQAALRYFRAREGRDGCLEFGVRPVSIWTAMYLIRNRMSRGGLGKKFAWSDRLRGGQPGDVNAWKSAGVALEHAHRRLDRTSIIRGSCQDTVARHDHLDTLIYVDLPYLDSVRTATGTYAVEAMPAPMGPGELKVCVELLESRGLGTSEGNLAHAQMLLRARAARHATIMISHYPCPLYDQTLDGWGRIDFDMPNHSGQGTVKQRRTESLYINHP